MDGLLSISEATVTLPSENLKNRLYPPNSWGGEIAHVPSVFSAFEHGLGFLLGGFDAFGGGFVEKILLVEQA